MINISDIRRYIEEVEHTILAPQTINTFIHRMVKKGYLGFERHRYGKQSRYCALISREDYLQEKLKNLVRVVYGGDKAACITDIENLEM